MTYDMVRFPPSTVVRTEPISSTIKAEIRKTDAGKVFVRFWIEDKWVEGLPGALFYIGQRLQEVANEATQLAVGKGI